jgi:hypothetical protein
MSHMWTTGASRGGSSPAATTMVDGGGAEGKQLTQGEGKGSFYRRS